MNYSAMGIVRLIEQLVLLVIFLCIVAVFLAESI